jgi:hypothetical protein
VPSNSFRIHPTGVQSQLLPAVPVLLLPAPPERHRTDRRTTNRSAALSHLPPGHRVGPGQHRDTVEGPQADFGIGSRSPRRTRVIRGIRRIIRGGGIRRRRRIIIGGIRGVGRGAKILIGFLMLLIEFGRAT